MNNGELLSACLPLLLSLVPRDLSHQRPAAAHLTSLPSPGNRGVLSSQRQWSGDPDSRGMWKVLVVTGWNSSLRSLRTRTGQSWVIGCRRRLEVPPKSHPDTLGMGVSPSPGGSSVPPPSLFLPSRHSALMPFSLNLSRQRSLSLEIQLFHVPSCVAVIYEWICLSDTPPACRQAIQSWRAEPTARRGGVGGHAGTDASGSRVPCGRQGRSGVHGRSGSAAPSTEFWEAFGKRRGEKKFPLYRVTPNRVWGGGTQR